MPQVAALVVKRGDETTNITYDVLTGAGGDGQPAHWRQDTGAPSTVPVVMRAFAWLKSLWNGPRTARKVLFHYEYPHAVLDTTTGLYSKVGSVVVDATLTVPVNLPPSAQTEGIRQGLNCLSATLIKQSAETGYAPTN